MENRHAEIVGAGFAGLTAACAFGAAVAGACACRLCRDHRAERLGNNLVPSFRLSKDRQLQDETGTDDGGLSRLPRKTRAATSRTDDR